MASATPSTPPAPYANVTAVNTSGPPPPNLPSEADVELDESFAANPGRLFGAYVTYSSSLSMLQDNIIVGIRDTITEQKSKFSNEGSYPSKTELMGEIEQDTYIEYVDSGTSRKAWKCTLCKKAGNGFFRCYRHVKGAEHTEALAELEAGRTAAEEVEKKEAAAKDAAASEKMEQDGVAAIADTW